MKSFLSRNARISRMIRLRALKVARTSSFEIRST